MEILCSFNSLLLIRLLANVPNAHEIRTQPVARYPPRVWIRSLNHLLIMPTPNQLPIATSLRNLPSHSSLLACSSPFPSTFITLQNLSFCANLISINRYLAQPVYALPHVTLSGFKSHLRTTVLQSYVPSLTPLAPAPIPPSFKQPRTHSPPTGPAKN